MRILISHTTYPSQFRRLISALTAQGHELIFVAGSSEWHAPAAPPGLKLIQYQTLRDQQYQGCHPWLQRFQDAIQEGQAVFDALIALRDNGWCPDWIINHVGWGNGLFLSDCFPDAKRIGLFEWFYNPEHSDVDFLESDLVSAATRQRLRIWNAQTLVELAACEYAVTPTRWQLQQFPASLRSRFRVIHEGIDWERLQQLRFMSQRALSMLPDFEGCEVVTYVSRGFDEYRGFPQAMRCIELLQKQRPTLHALIVGADCVAYGSPRADGRSWGTWARQELQLAPDRTHWLGSLQEEAYHAVLSVSDVHLYLTVPFVLSWSLLEAMAAGCAVVASATPPVEEVLRHGQSGLLVDFFDASLQAAAVVHLLEQPDLRTELKTEAQRTARLYSCEEGHRRWLELLGVDTPTTVF